MTREQVQQIARDLGLDADDERVLDRLYWHFSVVAA